MKKLLKLLFLILLGLIIALILIPIFFKAEVIQAIKSEINKTLNAEVDIVDADLSFIRSFPAVSIELESLSITGIDNFQDQNLFKADNIRLKTDFKSIFKSKEGMNIKAIILEKPKLDIHINENGEANYNIFKESKQQDNSATVFGEIDDYKIIDGQLNYSDLVSKNNINLSGINHSGSGKFENVVFDLHTNTVIDHASISNSGITYLNKAAVEAEVDLAVDLNNNKYTFKENLIRINDLDVSFIGDILSRQSETEFDLSFEAPNNKVSSILSLIPTQLKADLKNYYIER